MTKTKIERLKAIKEAFENTQARLEAVRRLEESAGSHYLSNLLENDLEQAELVLAAQDIMNKLQNMAEDLAKCNAQDLFPLVDKMKAAFGPEASHTFEESAQEAVMNAMNTVRHAKDELGNAIMRLEGKYPNDMAADVTPAPQPTDMETDSQPAGDVSADDVSGAMDDFGGADAASGPEAEPLGRARRESIQATKAPLSESVILETAGKKLLETEGLEPLIDWLLNEAANSMSSDNFRSFSKSVAMRASQDPAKLAGWIGKKKHGMGAMAQLAEPSYTATPALSVVEGIEEGKTWRRDDTDDDKAARYAARKDARKKKADDLDESSEVSKVMKTKNPLTGEEENEYLISKKKKTDEGKTFKRDPDDDDTDADNWTKKFKAKNRDQKRREKNSEVSESHQFIANKIAEMIEFNIQSTGKGNTAKVMEMFSQTFQDVTALNEGEGSDVTLADIFESVHGIKPVQYSIMKLKEFMAPMAPMAGAAPAKPSSSKPTGSSAPQIPLSSQDKKVAAGAMAKLASNMASDRSAAGRPVNSALSRLSGQERNVANKMIQGMKKGGQNPANLGDFTTAASAALGDQNNQDDEQTGQVQENINAAHWPTDTAGQYKGEAMQTDYGKLKAAPKTPKAEGSSESSTESSTESASEPAVSKEPKAPKAAPKKAAAPKADKPQGNPFAKKEEPKEAEESTEEGADDSKK